MCLMNFANMTSIQNLTAGNFVIIHAHPSSTGWGMRPGIVVEIYGNDQITVCPITRTFTEDKVKIGPNPPRNSSRWLWCPPGALVSQENCYINLMSSMTLGRWTDSPRASGCNWIVPRLDGQRQVFSLHPYHTDILQRMFSAQRCPFGTTSLPMQSPSLQSMILHEAPPAHQNVGNLMPGFPDSNPPPGSSASFQRVTDPGTIGSFQRVTDPGTTGSAQRPIVPWTWEEIEDMNKTVAFCQSDTEDDSVHRRVPWTWEEVEEMNKIVCCHSDVEDEAVPSAPFGQDDELQS